MNMYYNNIINIVVYRLLLRYKLIYIQIVIYSHLRTTYLI